MNNIIDIFKNISTAKLINSIIIIIVSIIIYKFIIYIINKGEEKGKSKLLKSNRSKTYLKLTKSVIRYIIIVLTLLILLQTNGIDVTSLLAGVGILGVILGLAVQDWIKDIIRGSSILSDNYFSVGDIVKYKDIEGTVLVIGLKTTKIQELKTSNVISIANRNIEEIQVVSNIIYVRVPMPYEVTVKKAEDIINQIIENVKKNNNVDGCKYKGVTELADSSIQYLLEVNCNPLYKLQVNRDTLRTILTTFEENNVSVPYNQLDVHTK